MMLKRSATISSPNAKQCSSAYSQHTLQNTATPALNRKNIRDASHVPKTATRTQPQHRRAITHTATITPIAASTIPQQQLEYAELVRKAVLEHPQFLEAIIKIKPQPKPQHHTVSIRPVTIKARRQLQFTYSGVKSQSSRNLEGVAAGAELQSILSGGNLSSVQLRTGEEDVNVQITRSGKVILHRNSRSSPLPALINLSHDRSKALPLSPATPHPFLQRMGLQGPDGKVKAQMQDKFTQVNEFLKLLGHSKAMDAMPDRPLSILDCGCGSSHLTFGTYHYLNNVLNRPASLSGVDLNAALLKRSSDACVELGLEGVSFTACAILDYRPANPPDIVLALHACDTATDHALALGVQQAATLIMAVPCCHKDLHQQMGGGSSGNGSSGSSSPHPFGPIMRHGIMKQRMVDLLTDSFRALLLRLAGYRTDVVEFVSAEHTPRNLLLRAVRIKEGSSGLGPASMAIYREEYISLKEFWGVTPALESLLQAHIAVPLQRGPDE